MANIPVAKYLVEKLKKDLNIKHTDKCASQKNIDDTSFEAPPPCNCDAAAHMATFDEIIKNLE